MPISFAVGTVRSPEFPVKHETYDVTIDVERKFPLGELKCKMAIQPSPDHCEAAGFETLLDADWRVLDGTRVIAEGSVHGRGRGFAVSNKYFTRYLGDFVGEANRRYVVEMRFAKDGTELNVTNPHLIVMMTKPTD